ncbi:hypothetical protein RF11_10324 [Thelohanellus kitauei]|uniref:Uncharacterized protein n=1 Tax=Thelohanellus kitauei TaxID=669202 RepID=A0A0C2MD40_THEKT|nr:hypothetical protein RF11_10324 [Thelohanellus kitauei]
MEFYDKRKCPKIVGGDKTRFIKNETNRPFGGKENILIETYINISYRSIDDGFQYRNSSFDYQSRLNMKIHEHLADSYDLTYNDNKSVSFWIILRESNVSEKTIDIKVPSRDATLNGIVTRGKHRNPGRPNIRSVMYRCRLEHLQSPR